MKTYKLDITIAAQEDLERLYDFLSDHDTFLAERAVAAIEKSYEFLELSGVFFELLLFKSIKKVPKILN